MGTGLKSPRTSPSVFAYWYQSNTGGNKGLGMRLSTVHCVGIMQSSICTCPPTYIDWLLMYLLDSMWYAAFSNHVPTWILLVFFLCCVHNQQLHKTQITIVNNKRGGALIEYKVYLSLSNVPTFCKLWAKVGPANLSSTKPKALDFWTSVKYKIQQLKIIMGLFERGFCTSICTYRY